MALDLEYDLSLDESNPQASKQSRTNYIQEELSLNDIHHQGHTGSSDANRGAFVKREYESSCVSFSQGKPGMLGKFDTQNLHEEYPNQMLNTDDIIENILAHPQGIKRLKVGQNLPSIKEENTLKTHFRLLNFAYVVKKSLEPQQQDNSQKESDVWVKLELEDTPEEKDSEPSEGGECYIDGKKFKKYGGLLYEVVDDLLDSCL